MKGNEREREMQQRLQPVVGVPSPEPQGHNNVLRARKTQVAGDTKYPDSEPIITLNVCQSYEHIVKYALVSVFIAGFNNANELHVQGPWPHLSERIDGITGNR